MSENNRPTFNVYRKEPLARAIFSTGITPVGLGIVFFVFVSLSLSIWGALLEVPQTKNEDEAVYVSFFANISWSAAILFLFPFVVALSLKYYSEIPRLFVYLFEEIAEIPESEKKADNFYRWLDARFNSYRVSGLILALTLVLNALYFSQILQEQKFIGWMTSGELLGPLLGWKRGLTLIGLYAGVIQIVLIYWVLNLLWRGVVLAWGLHEFFNRRGFTIKVKPLHPDGCGGFGKIGDVAMLLNLTLFLLGIYVSLKVVDKVVIQGSSLGADIGNPIMLAGYVILAPLLFFFPLGAVHRLMKRAKEQFLSPVGQQCTRLFGELASAGLDDKGLVAVRTFSELKKVRSSLRKEIPVWPFDFKSLQVFVGTIVVPVIPVVLPFVMKLIVEMFPGMFS